MLDFGPGKMFKPILELEVHYTFRSEATLHDKDTRLGARFGAYFLASAPFYVKIPFVNPWVCNLSPCFFEIDLAPLMHAQQLPFRIAK